MGKKEKYIRFVVDDLVVNTHLKFNEELIFFPWNDSIVHAKLEDGTEYVLFQYVYQYLNNRWEPHRGFVGMLSEKYGVNETEYNLIWFSYMERLKWLIERGRENG